MNSAYKGSLTGGAADLPIGGGDSPPGPMDTGQVKGGRVTFPNWKSEADRPPPEPPAPMPPGQRVGFAVIGLGRLTLEQILPAFSACARARVTALVSGTPDKARAVAAQYGIPDDALFGYGDIGALADRPDVQAVYVVTPNGRHRDQVRAAAAAGKHVLCEKPMANTSAEARDMIAACAAAKVRLMIAYRCQFEPFNVEAARIAQSGELGAVRLIEASNVQSQGPSGQWRYVGALAGGGALPDIGLYCLNGARALLREEPEEVFATVVTPAGDSRYAEVEETIAFTLRFPSGAIAQCAASYGAHEGRDMRVRLERGSIELENAFAYAGQRLRLSYRDGAHEVVTEKRLPAANQFALEIDHFAGCILDGTAPRTPGEEGLRDLLILEALYRSAREGRPVRLADDDQPAGARA